MWATQRLDPTFTDTTVVVTDNSVLLWLQIKKDLVHKLV